MLVSGGGEHGLQTVKGFTGIGWGMLAGCSSKGDCNLKQLPYFQLAQLGCSNSEDVLLEIWQLLQIAQSCSPATSMGESLRRAKQALEQLPIPLYLP